MRQYQFETSTSPQEFKLLTILGPSNFPQDKFSDSFISLLMLCRQRYINTFKNYFEAVMSEPFVHKGEILAVLSKFKSTCCPTELCFGFDFKTTKNEVEIFN